MRYAWDVCYVEAVSICKINKYALKRVKFSKTEGSSVICYSSEFLCVAQHCHRRQKHVLVLDSFVSLLKCLIIRGWVAWTEIRDALLIPGVRAL